MHPFYPLAGREFEFVAFRQNWGEDRVHLHDENGQLFSLPAGWTDVVAADPFVVIAAGRCPFTTAGLLAVADLVDRCRARRKNDRDVKAITPVGAGLGPLMLAQVFADDMAADRVPSVRAIRARVQAAEVFAADVAGRVPSNRAIRSRLRVGQSRAQKVHAYIRTRLESARELADAGHITVMAAINSATADLLANEDEDMTALGRALGTVRNYAEVLDALHPPETVAADLDANLGERHTATSYLIALTRIAHETVAARCAETGEDVVSYPLLLTRTAEALRRGTVTLPDDCAVEFQELGG
jgi:hypothetical protein